MTLFEELGIEYREENGIQYPVLSVDTEGMRLDVAEEVNEEAYERLDNIEIAWLKTHMTGKKTFMEQLHMRNQARMMAEEIVINEIVHKCR